MKIQEFLKLLGQSGRLNHFAICSDTLGLSIPHILQRALAQTTAVEDIYFYDAKSITKEKAREIERDARTRARGGSELNVFYIYSLQKLRAGSVGPLLKAVEDAKSSRFIFQAQSIPRKIHTLMSRSSVVRLPFVSRASVLATMQRMNLDAKAVDELNLWDGTLAGTIKALEMKDEITAIRRELSMGRKGIPYLFNKETLKSPALEAAIYNFLTPEEREFLSRHPAAKRKKLAIFLASLRQ